MSLDLQSITQGWDYQPGRVIARWVTGGDGVRRVQLRVDLGVLQMELDGRPDGRRPHGYESLLDFHRRIERTSTNAPRVRLSAAECGELQQEAVQYYYRYLAFAALEHTDGLLRDTEHNLEIIRLIQRLAPDETVSWQFVQFFPYVRMMNAQARAQKMLDDGSPEEAERLVTSSIEEIRTFAREHGLPTEPARMGELHTLEEFRARILARRPVSPAEKMRAEMAEAIAAEDYERAAALRDELRRLV
ncbi:MAG: hypothetical protein FJ221_05490 [Lentisphaerae bacterium]|nr:hypothetical protein [Lentisphaerota bacterium]